MLKQYDHTLFAGVNLVRRNGVSLPRRSGVYFTRISGVSLNGISNLSKRLFLLLLYQYSGINSHKIATLYSKEASRQAIDKLLKRENISINPNSQLYSLEVGQLFPFINQQDYSKIKLWSCLDVELKNGLYGIILFKGLHSESEQSIENSIKSLPDGLLREYYSHSWIKRKLKEKEFSFFKLIEYLERKTKPIGSEENIKWYGCNLVLNENVLSYLIFSPKNNIRLESIKSEVSPE